MRGGAAMGGNMKKLWLPVLSGMCLLFLCMLIAFFFIEVSILTRLSISAGFFLLSLLLLYLLTRSAEKQKKERLRKYFLIVLFLLYTAQLFYLLFFAPEFSRDSVSLTAGQYLDSLREQWEYNTNLTPFKTIKGMLAIYESPAFSNMISHINLYGNLIAFMPFSYFLPRIFSSMRRPFVFLRRTLFMIAAIEILQFFTLTGSMDIDDVILNYAGILLTYPLALLLIRRYHLPALLEA